MHACHSEAQHKTVIHSQKCSALKGGQKEVTADALL